MELVASITWPPTILIGEKTLVVPWPRRAARAGIAGKDLNHSGAAHMIPLTHAAAVGDAVHGEITS